MEISVQNLICLVIIGYFLCKLYLCATNKEHFLNMQNTVERYASYLREKAEAYILKLDGTENFAACTNPEMLERCDNYIKETAKQMKLLHEKDPKANGNIDRNDPVLNSLRSRMSHNRINRSCSCGGDVDGVKHFHNKLKEALKDTEDLNFEELKAKYLDTSKVELIQKLRTPDFQCKTVGDKVECNSEKFSVIMKSK